MYSMGASNQLAEYTLVSQNYEFGPYIWCIEIDEFIVFSHICDVLMTTADWKI